MCCVSPRFVTVYNGPCHTYKVQRLSESTTYHFRIQAYNDAGEGAFSEVCAFTTTKSPPAPLKGELALPWQLLQATGGQDWILQAGPQPAFAGTETETLSEGLCLGGRKAPLLSSPPALQLFTPELSVPTFAQLEMDFAGLSIKVTAVCRQMRAQLIPLIFTF